jgi:tetratricopeptide (TPR) repeat protein
MKPKWSIIVPACVFCMGAPNRADAEQLSDLAKAQAADPAAPYIRASAWVQTGNGGPAFVELLTNGDEAALRERTQTNANPKLQLITYPTDVVTLLADKKMQFLWEPLLDWAGGTIEFMRDRTLAKLRVAAAAGNAAQPSSTTSESAVGPKVRSTIQLAQFLIAIGRISEADQMLAGALAHTKRSSIEWFSLAAWIASARWSAGDDEGAIRQYEFIESTMGNSPYTANAKISRASLLAQSGRYNDALQLIDSTWAAWTRDNREQKISGSYRQFAWIRACALEGLGRHAEARTAFQPVLQSRDTRDPHFVVESDDELTMNGFKCMKDSRAVIGLLKDGLVNDLHPRAVTLLQPGFQPTRDVGFWEEVRSDPELRKAAADRMSVLSPSLSAALNGWRVQN